MSTARLILHIVYVHGFQGDHTTFQSFPTDLHVALQPQLPQHIELRSILYPTYKSKRPITIATQNFLNWLEKLPAGPVILCGHSMGGLLVAEAATDPSHAASKRVIALLGYDVPFLGMHPHVVVSGIASLLPNKKGDSSGGGNNKLTDNPDGGGLKSEREMNDARHVNVPAEGSISSNASTASIHSSGSPALPSPSATSLAPPPLPPRPSSNKQTQAHSPRSLSPSPTPAFISRTLEFIESHSNDPLVRFVTKHHSDPLAAAKRWVIESFEFGICMFDPKGLRDRYAKLEGWSGEWVAFWTESGPDDDDLRGGKDGKLALDEGRPDDKAEGMQQERDETEALGKLLEPSVDSQSPQHLEKDVKAREKELKAQEKALRKQQEKELKALRKQHNVHSPHHFVVRPFRAPTVRTHHWEQVKIRGSKDEVEAHCGLFLPNLNYDYAAFVGRVAAVVRGWAEGL